MKRKGVVVIAVLAAVVVVCAAAVHVHRTLGFFRDAQQLNVEEFHALLPSPDDLVFAAQHETDRFYLELMVFHDEPLVLGDVEFDGVQFLWRIEPRGNTRLHRYEFHIWEETRNIAWSQEDVHRMFVRYGDAVVERSTWAAFVVEPVRVPARNGLLPTNARADAVWILARGSGTSSPPNPALFSASLDIRSGATNRLVEQWLERGWIFNETSENG